MEVVVDGRDFWAEGVSPSAGLASAGLLEQRPFLLWIRLLRLELYSYTLFRSFLGRI